MVNPRVVSSLKKGLDILGVFTPEFPKLKFGDIGLKTGFSKATVSRVLHTLIALNYLSFDPILKCYFLGPKVMSLGFAALSGMSLRDIARPWLEDLSQITQQNVNLGILSEGEIVYIERIEKKKILKVDFRVGSRVNAYQTSIGRAILAFLRQEEFRTVLKNILKSPDAVKHVGRNGERLVKLLKEVRERGFALNDEEFLTGLRAIAAPIFDNRGNVEGAINIPVFSYEVSRDELLEKYVPILLSTTQQISASRGFTKHVV